jgi:adenine-specific DNA-methyltransferase
MGLPREDEAEFNFTTRDGKKARLLGLRKRGGDWKRSDRPNMYYPFYVNPQTKEVRVAPDSSFTEEVLPKRPSGEESRWTWGKSTASERSGELVAKEIKRGDKTEYDIYRLDLFETESGTAKLQKLKSLWDEKELNYQNARGIFKDLFGNSEVFDFPKPIEMIMKMMRSLNDKDCIVVDFFSGSGTTGHAVMQLNLEDGGNRTHIQVQLPEPTFTVNKNNEEVPTKAGAVAFNLGFRSISQVAIERIRRAGIKIREANAELIAKRSTPFDTGFRVYRLAPSNFVQWDESEAKDNIQQAVLDFAANKKPDAAPESLLAEIMLQSRIQLDARIEKRDLQTSGWVYIVDGGNLIAYVADEQITEAQVNEIAELAPAKLVILDSAFNGNNALKINVMNICKEKFIKEFKTI